jgi:hypothetical protein
MQLVGFDEGIARANGYRVVTLSEGLKASVPARFANVVRTAADVQKAGGDVQNPDSVPWLRFRSQSGFTTQARGSDFARGNCGSSRLDLHTGPTGYSVNTGFDLVGGRQAIAHKWYIVVRGPHHERRYQWNQPFELRSWWRNGMGQKNGRNIPAPTGFYSAGAGGNEAFVILKSGGLCTSALLVTSGRVQAAPGGN